MKLLQIWIVGFVVLKCWSPSAQAQEWDSGKVTMPAEGHGDSAGTKGMATPWDGKSLNLQCTVWVTTWNSEKGGAKVKRSYPVDLQYYTAKNTAGYDSKVVSEFEVDGYWLRTFIQVSQGRIDATNPQEYVTMIAESTGTKEGVRVLNANASSMIKANEVPSSLSLSSMAEDRYSSNPNHYMQVYLAVDCKKMSAISL